MNSAAAWQQARRDLNSRVRALRALSYADLARLPDSHTEKEEGTGRWVTFTTYRTTLPDNRLKVVVQAFMRRFLFFSYIDADGFYMTLGGDIEPLKEVDLWEFT
jgi:hypothetical protein